MNNEDKILTKIVHRKENEWIPLGEHEEWWSEVFQCPFCGNKTLDAGKFCSWCGKQMSGGRYEDD